MDEKGQGVTAANVNVHVKFNSEISKWGETVTEGKNNDWKKRSVKPESSNLNYRPKYYFKSLGLVGDLMPPTMVHILKNFHCGEMF